MGAACAARLSTGDRSPSPTDGKIRPSFGASSSAGDAADDGWSERRGGSACAIADARMSPMLARGESEARLSATSRRQGIRDDLFPDKPMVRTNTAAGLVSGAEANLASAFGKGRV